jgi:phosphosulfolactate synthase
MPVPGRSEKPRKEGLTMIIDKGLGIGATQDLLDGAADYIDFIKLTFGTSAFIDIDVLMEKVELIKDYDIWICPGGTFLEVSVWQGAYGKYLKRCKELGFNAIEVSDGTIEIDLKTRRDCIKKAVDMGFMVVSEVGKKDPDDKVATSMLHEEIAADLRPAPSRSSWKPARPARAWASTTKTASRKTPKWKASSKASTISPSSNGRPPSRTNSST